ncbi:hypothetical protein ACFOEE_12695 [Pseudoalteromonas fenneropenaei]|uniref:Uncharacterized protein n=1 Tax=Pseudoalteromonas fenneropenaei TaxID=1737459 RepID=A0ABV7CLF0_9GAMM
MFRFLAFLLALSVITPALGSPAAVLTPAQWQHSAMVTPWPDNSDVSSFNRDPVAVSADSSYSLAAEQSAWLWLPAYRWLQVPVKDVKATDWSAGNTPFAQARLDLFQWQCQEQHCQLPSSAHNRWLRVTNHNTTARAIPALEGRWQSADDAFWQPRALALSGQRLNQGAQSSYWYQLEAKQSVQLFFANPSYIKIAFRQDLTLLDDAQPGALNIYLNEQLVTRLVANQQQALEFNNVEVSIARSEFLNIPANSYLRVSANALHWLQISDAARPFLDMRSNDKLPLPELLPTWYKSLNNTAQAIYLAKDISALNPAANQLRTNLAQRRQADLEAIFTLATPLTPTLQTQPITTMYRQETVQEFWRQVEDLVYPASQARHLQSHNLTEQMTFQLPRRRVTDKVSLYLRATRPSQLTLQSESLTQQIQLVATESWVKLDIAVPLQTKQLLFTTNEPLQLALVAQTLAPLPYHAGWLSQPGSNQQIAPAIEQWLAEQQAQRAELYLSASRALDNTSTAAEQSAISNSTSTSQGYYLLGEAAQLMTDAPLLALPTLKQLTSHSDINIASKAWQLRIKALRLLQESNLAERYLRSLLQSAQPELAALAAELLIDYYQHTAQWYPLLSLCSSLHPAPADCKAHQTAWLMEEQQWLALAWHSREADAEHFTLAKHWLGWTDDDVRPQPVSWQMQQHGQLMLQTATGEQTVSVLNQAQSITLQAEQDSEVRLKVRAAFTASSTERNAWLKLSGTQQAQFLPIINDISAEQLTLADGTPLSIASNARFTLHQGQSLTLSSDTQLYLEIALQPLAQATIRPQPLPSEQWLSPHLSAEQFIATLYGAPVDPTTLINNALYLLERNELSQAHYIAVLQRLHWLKYDQTPEPRYARLMRYGEWQEATRYLDFASAELIPLDTPIAASQAERILRHSVSKDLPGIVLRANHLLQFDLSKLQTSAVRLALYYSSAEFAPHQNTEVAITYQGQTTSHTITEQEPLYLGFELPQIAEQIPLTLQWLTPQLAEMVTVELEVPSGNGQWQTFLLDNQQRFYRADAKQAVKLELTHDSWLKLEYWQPSGRVEQQAFYPAGRITLAAATQFPVRAQSWQLRSSKEKLNYRKQLVQPIGEPWQANTIAVTQVQWQDAPTQLTDAPYWYGELRLREQGIFEGDDELTSNAAQQLALGFKQAWQNHWLQGEVSKSVSPNFQDYWQLDLGYRFRDTEQSWYAKADLITLWQPSTAQFDALWRATAKLALGQYLNSDTLLRHRWQFQGFYSDSNIDGFRYYLQPDISPALFTYYREDHHTGWQWDWISQYQPYLDQRWQVGASLLSNADWQSLDTARFTLDWQQFYQGQTLNLGLSSRYRFADDNRAQSFWQYYFNARWQLPLQVTQHLTAWFSLDWQRSLQNADSNLAITLQLGNLGTTGYNPFAFDEVMFESLRVTELLRSLEESYE